MWLRIYRLLDNGDVVFRFSSIKGLFSPTGWKQLSDLAWKYLKSNMAIMTGTEKVNLIRNKVPEVAFERIAWMAKIDKITPIQLKKP